MIRIKKKLVHHCDFLLLFRFEKYIGGKYLGEVVRVILAKLTKERLLFVGDSTSDSLLTPGNLTTDLVSHIEQ